jgi:hypothetical protein
VALVALHAAPQSVVVSIEYSSAIQGERGERLRLDIATTLLLAAAALQRCFKQYIHYYYTTTDQQDGLRSSL